MDKDAVWAETTDGGLLRQLFGYYPTLHDAVIRTVELSRGGEALTIVVDYNDAVEEADRDGLTVRIRLIWRGVRRFEFPIGDEDLLSVDFKRQGDRLITSLETWPGMFATVDSATFEAELMQVDPRGEGDRPWFTYG